MYKLLTAFVLCTVAAVATAASVEDPLAGVAEQASVYGENMAKAAGYEAQDRRILADAARVLAAHGQCANALEVRRSVVSGPVEPGFEAWRALAEDAICAGAWDDAVAGAQLAVRVAPEDGRQGAFLLLGRALEGHWRYGPTEALEAYRRAIGYGPLPDLKPHVAELEANLAEQSALRLDRHYVQTEAARPFICLDFNRRMSEPAERNYGDYIRFEPFFEPRFELVSGDEICAEGASYATLYRVHILAGLESADGARWMESAVRNVQVEDRDPSLWFENSFYVLPRGGGGVPLRAVNVERVELQLYRIGERNLSQEFVRRTFRSDIDGQDARSIRERFGELIWSGSADLDIQRNRETLTNLPVALLAQPVPGIYVLTAKVPTEDEQDCSYCSVAAQWLVVSDIGLTTYRGADGLAAVVRSLATAEPLPGVRLTLYGRNNRLLAETVSDEAGKVRIPAEQLAGEGGRSPELLMAFGPEGDFNFFDLSASAFDLSDRGVDGRPAPGPLDAFLYTERGVYRPGETVHLAALLRDDGGLAVDGLPLTLRLLRPDEEMASERVVQPQAVGGYVMELPVSKTARSGRWKVLAYVDPDADPVGETGFLVEAIVPPRIEVDFTRSPEGPLRPEADYAFGIEARYLFGAAAAELRASAEVRVEADPDPFPQYPGYRFGVADEPDDSVLLPLEGARTDAGGRAEFDFRVSRLPRLNRPLRARLRAEVADVDGRGVAASVWLPLRRDPLSIGIQPPASDGVLSEGEAAVFNVLVLGADDEPVSRDGLKYRLLEEQTTYQWFREGRQWRYKRQLRERTVREGSLNVAAGSTARLSVSLPIGRYRLEVRDVASGVLSSARAQVGWQAAGPRSETPDMLTLVADRGSYLPGETALLRVEAPFTGHAELVLANHTVLSVREIDLPEKQITIEVPVEAAWGAGAYALVTAYRPDDGPAGHGPRRAIGVAWLGLSKDERRLDVSFQLPESILPRQRFPLRLNVSGQTAGRGVFVTVAAVDEGVLQLTGYRSPDPLEYFYGQRRLGVEVRDLYGALIDGRQGVVGRLRSGGGASGRQGAPDTHTQIVSLFSGIVTVDDRGQAEVPLDLPDFNGRLRLSAVAWNGSRLGSARGDLRVRDPVVMSPSLPRFLAVGDQSRASVLVQNIDGPEGDYLLSSTFSGALAGTGFTDIALSLRAGQREVVNLPLEAMSLGEGRLGLTLQGPDGRSLKRSVEVGVRAPFLPLTRRRLARVGPGKDFTIGPDLAAGLRTDTLAGLLSVTAQPDLDVPGLLRQLDLYPYGCLEQLTSRAFPLLHLHRLADRWGYDNKLPADDRLAEAVTRILEKQLDNGAFALWSPDGDEEPWLSAYALDFLQRAREAGVPVPDFAWKRGADWLRRTVTYPQSDDMDAMGAQAYALYVLARAGEAHPETARYLLDQAGQRLPSALAAAQLGAALALMGDSERAGRAFALTGKISRDPGLRDYGSTLRDMAAQLLLEAEIAAADSGAGVAGQVEAMAERLADSPWLSTQEQAWLVRAADAVTGEGGPLELSLNGTRLPAREGALVLKPSPETLSSSGVRLGNAGAEAVWYSATVSGSPVEEPPAHSAGFRIRRILYGLDGGPIDPGQVRQGEVAVAVIDGTVEGEALTHQALVVDPLPAGFELENARLANARLSADLTWLQDLSATLYTEALDDRFVAALDLDPSQRTFRLSYLVRAVTPGHYRMPPVEVEDMYKPSYRGRGESGWLRVLSAD